MGKGDRLAGGMSSATFQQASSQSEVEHDLKILPRESFQDKYGIGDLNYASLVEKLQLGEPLPQMIPLEDEAPEPVFMSAVTPSVALESEIASASDDKPQVGYRGNPFGDQILVQRVEKEHSSNIILPDSMKSKSDIGFVVAIGDLVTRMREGQLILFDRFASHGADVDLIDEDGIQRKYLLLKEYDVLLSLEKVSVEDRKEL